MDIISNVLQLASQHGLNDQDICKILGLSKSGVYHWKNGKGEPSASQVIILSNYFNVSTDYLLTGKEASLNLITITKENKKMDENATNKDGNPEQSKNEVDLKTNLFVASVPSVYVHTEIPSSPEQIEKLNKVIADAKLYRTILDEIDPVLKKHGVPFERIAGLVFKSELNESNDDTQQQCDSSNAGVNNEREQELLGLLYKFDTDRKQDKFIGRVEDLANKMLKEYASQDFEKAE